MSNGFSPSQEEHEQMRALGRQLEEQVVALRGQLRTAEQENTRLRNEAVALQRTNAAHVQILEIQKGLLDQMRQSQTSGKEESSRRGARIPDPPVYHADMKEDKIDLTTWKIKMVDKLEQEKKDFSTPLAQFRYVYSRLGTNAEMQLRHYADNNYQLAVKELEGNPDAEGYDIMFKVLDNAFGDPNKQENAQIALEKVQQGQRPFIEYYAEFCRYAADTKYDNITLLHRLKAGLSRQLIRALVYVEADITTLSALVAVCQRIDNGLRNAALQGKEERHAPYHQKKSTPRVLAPVAPAAQLEQPNDPMEIDTHTNATRVRAKWVSVEEIGRRRERNLCLRCGGHGHMIKDCPYGPPRRPTDASSSPSSSSIRQRAVLVAPKEEKKEKKERRKGKGKEAPVLEGDSEPSDSENE